MRIALRIAECGSPRHVTDVHARAEAAAASGSSIHSRVEAPQPLKPKKAAKPAKDKTGSGLDVPQDEEEEDDDGHLLEEVFMSSLIKRKVEPVLI